MEVWVGEEGEGIVLLPAPPPPQPPSPLLFDGPGLWGAGDSLWEEVAKGAPRLLALRVGALHRPGGVCLELHVPAAQHSTAQRSAAGSARAAGNGIERDAAGSRSGMRAKMLDARGGWCSALSPIDRPPWYRVSQMKKHVVVFVTGRVGAGRVQ